MRKPKQPSLLGEQADGTYKIPKADSVSTPQCLTESASFTETGSQIQPTGQQSITPVPVRKGPTEVEKHCYRLVDLIAATLKYAKEHHAGIVREEDARAMAITVYIQSAKLGLIKKRRAG